MTFPADPRVRVLAPPTVNAPAPAANRTPWTVVAASTVTAVVVVPSNWMPLAADGATPACQLAVFDRLPSPPAPPHRRLTSPAIWSWLMLVVPDAELAPQA